MIFNIGLVNNAALLLSMVLIYEIFALRRKFDSPARKIALGLIFGSIGVAVMMSSWEFAPGVIFDTRSVLLSVGALFFGTLPTIIAIAMTAAFRLFQGGPGVYMGVAVIILSGVIGLIWRHLKKESLDKLSYFEIYLFGLVVTIVMFACVIFLPWNIAWEVLSAMWIPVIILYPFATLMTGGLMRERLIHMNYQQELAENEVRYRNLSNQFNALLDGIPDKIILMSPDLKILWANNNAIKAAKIKKDELVGSNCHTVWRNSTEPCSNCPVLKSLMSGKPTVEITSDQNNRTIEIRTVPIIENGKVINVLEIVRDITEQKKLERQLIHAQKMEAIGALAGGVAHDFNNILTAIIGFTNMAILKASDNEPLRRNLENILKGAEKAAHLTKELLLFSRKQAGEPKPVDIIELIKNFERHIKRILRENIDYKATLSYKPLLVLADSLQIEQALINFASNARDAMPDGGLFSITVERFIMDENFVKTNSFGSIGDYVKITISDTGKGMDNETLEYVFDPFFSTKEVGKGSGLGLAAVYGIIKSHGGHITAYSEAGKGTTFTIYLPLIEKNTSLPLSASHEKSQTFGSETILLAEDDEQVRYLAQTALRQYGYKVIEAEDGKDAIDKFKQNSQEIKLLILDLIMPRINGLTAFKEISRINPDIKAIFFSGYDSDAIEDDILKKENVYTLHKPLSLPDLLKKVRSALDGLSTEESQRSIS